MFRVDNYEVSYMYVTAKGSLLKEQGANVPRKFFDKELRVVNCAIFDTEKGDVVYAEDAICNPEDVFCKSVGRRVSLTKVLKKSEFPKELRKEFWTRYFNTVSKKERKLVCNQ